MYVRGVIRGHYVYLFSTQIICIIFVSEPELKWLFWRPQQRYAGLCTTCSVSYSKWRINLKCENIFFFTEIWQKYCFILNISYQVGLLEPKELGLLNEVGHFFHKKGCQDPYTMVASTMHTTVKMFSQKRIFDFIFYVCFCMCILIWLHPQCLSIESHMPLRLQTSEYLKVCLVVFLRTLSTPVTQ